MVSAFTMPFAAKLSQKIDPRIMLVLGASTLAFAIFSLGRLAPQTGESALFWPLNIRSIGTVAMFLPLTLATIGPIPKKDIAAATAFFSLTRQLGGSIGVAALTTILGNRQTYHRAMMLSHLDPANPDVLNRVATFSAGFMNKGMDPTTAKAQALGALDGMVRLQSAILAFNDCFWLVGVLIVVTMPLIFVLGKPPKGIAVDAGH